MPKELENFKKNFKEVDPDINQEEVKKYLKTIYGEDQEPSYDSNDKAQNFGRVLDPIADKLLVASTLMMMVDRNIAPVLPALVILCREILVSGMREYLAELKVKVSLPVSHLAKVKTAAQMIAIIILLLGEETTGIPYTNLIGKISIWLAAVLTVITGYEYLRQGIKYFD